MTLGFSTHINGQPTYFPEKIWDGLFEHGILDPTKDNEFWGLCTHHKEINTFKVFESLPKIHTIRKDEKDRWKVGSKIHFVIKNRTKDRFQFAPVLRVKSIQSIQIRWTQLDSVYVYINEKCYVANYTLDTLSAQRNSRMKALARNDGFDSVEDFLKWFKQDFDGKIIHWTDHKY